MPELLSGATEPTVGPEVQMIPEAGAYTYTLRTDGRGAAKVSLEVKMPTSGQWASSEEFTFTISKNETSLVKMVTGGRRTVRARLHHVGENTDVYAELEPTT